MKENELIEKVGKRNPFQVPEDYFDTLASQIMEKVDAEGVQPREIQLKNPATAKRVWLRPLLYAAACICALFISVTAYQSFSRQEAVESPAQEMVASQVATDDSFDEAFDYVMVDNQDIYACLTSDY